MAILNYIKSGTYTRIATLSWGNGKPEYLVLHTFEEKPDDNHAYPFEEMKDDDGKSQGWVNSNAPSPMIETTVPMENVWKPANKADIFDKYFAQSVWTASGSNMHSQMYKYLLSLDMFDGCSSDE